MTTLRGIAEARICLVFRRWKRPTVKAGGTLNTPIGVLSIDSVDVVEERDLTRKAAQQAGFQSKQELMDSLGDREGQLFRIGLTLIEEDPRVALREEADLDEHDLANLRQKLERLDSRSKSGPWTAKTLQLIADHPKCRAADLAQMDGCDKDRLKTNVRKLKNLGLTESLEVGYQLSPRGMAFLKAAR